MHQRAVAGRGRGARGGAEGHPRVSCTHQVGAWRGQGAPVCAPGGRVPWVAEGEAWCACRGEGGDEWERLRATCSPPRDGEEDAQQEQRMHRGAGVPERAPLVALWGVMLAASCSDSCWEQGRAARVAPGQAGAPGLGDSPMGGMVLGTAPGTQRVLCCARWEAAGGWSRMSCALRGTCMPSQAEGRSAAGAFRCWGFIFYLFFCCCALRPVLGKAASSGRRLVRWIPSARGSRLQHNREGKEAFDRVY